MNKNNFLLILALLFMSSIHDTFATHGAGLDISYECLTQGTTSDIYQITVRYYRDCSSNSTAASTFSLNYSSSCNSGTLNVPQISGPIFITPLCLGSSNPCNNGGLVELEEYIYQTTISLIHCSNWVMTVCASGNRNNAITTIQNPASQSLCVEAEINNSSICNTSPSFTEYPAPYICIGQPYCYNNGAIDIDGDSLVYSLETPNNGNGGITYIGPWSSQNPISGTTNFDSFTGDLCLNTTQAQVSVIAMKITEYRNGVKIGSVVRDIQIIVLSCLTSPPILSGFNGIPQDVTNASALDDSLHFCANGLDNINFTINSALGTSNNKTISWSGINSAPSASFSITNNNSNNPAGIFNWTPQLNDVINSPFSFTINVADDACPINNLFSYTYTITLSSNASFNIIYNQVNSPSCIGYNDGNIDLTVGGITGPASYVWSGTNGFSSNTEDIDSLFAGNYNFTIIDAAGCVGADTIEIIDPPNLNVVAVLDSVSCVGGNNGGIDITVTPNNGLLLYSWIGPNGFTSNNEDINSLTAGIYAVEIIDSSSCIFNETVILPFPNPFNTSVFVDSVSCSGYNDGAIDLTVVANSSLIYAWSGPNGFISNNEDIDSLFSGTYNITIMDASSCVFVDSFFLADPDNITSSISINACDSYLWNSSVYTISGVYTYALTASNSCDSTAILNLIINNSTNSMDTVVACDEYMWNGTKYTASGDYTFYTLNSAGCDSMADLNLTIEESTFSFFSIQDCNAYTWNGTLYEESGIYTYLTTNAVGCDSLARLDLQITSYGINAVTPICIYDSSEIMISIVDPTFNEYTITISDLISSSIYVVDSLGLLITNGTPIRVSPQESTNLILKSVIDINNCASYPNDSSFIFVNGLPLVELDLFDFCQNEPTFEMDQGSPNGGQYLIDSNEVDFFVASSMEIGEHLVQYIYTDSNTNCSNIAEETIIIFTPPRASFYCDAYIAKQDTPITFFNSSTDFTNLTWYLRNDIIQDSIILSYAFPDTGIYVAKLIALNEHNCSDTAMINLSIIPSHTIYIPTAFTPNNDLLNNSFSPFGVGIKSYTLKIYNRWGDIIFNEENTPWSAIGCQDGQYAYFMEIINIKNMRSQYRGRVMLIK